MKWVYQLSCAYQLGMTVSKVWFIVELGVKVRANDECSGRRVAYAQW